MPNRIAQLTFAAFFSVVSLALNCPGQFTNSYSYTGPEAYGNFGRSVSGAGDVNGDGYADFIVGLPTARLAGVQVGAARVYSGQDGTLLYSLFGDSDGDVFGSSVSGAGDVNGDGFDDIIIGAVRDDDLAVDGGSARVFSGLDGSVLYTFHGSAPGGFLGSTVSDAGDVNQDGFADVIVGAHADSTFVMNAGSAWVYSGFDGSVLFSFFGTHLSDNLGNSVSGAGDVNNDGFDDVIIGISDAPSSNSIIPQAGRAVVYSGVDGSLLHSFEANSTQIRFGGTVSDAGDVDRDGYADFIIGADRENLFAGDTGSVRVYSGFDGSVIHTFFGVGNDRFGNSASGAGDVDGDGFPDIIVGAYFDGTNGTRAGAVYVFSGADGSTIDIRHGADAFGQVGFSVSGAGDVNRDGFADVIIGTPFFGPFFGPLGIAEVLLADTRPVLNYSTKTGARQFLHLDWLPVGTGATAVQGMIRCSGAGPGSSGLIGASLAPQDMVLFGYLPLLISDTSTDLILSETFNFDVFGQLLTTTTRQNPVLAGLQVYVQCFEIAPLVLASNGLRFLIVP